MDYLNIELRSGALSPILQKYFLLELLLLLLLLLLL